MINLISQLTGNGSEQLLPPATEAVPPEGGEKKVAEETFLQLMSGFLGMNISAGNKSNPEDMPAAVESNTVNETVLKKAETEDDTDWVNLQKPKENDQSGSGYPFKTEEFLGSTFIQFGKTVPVESEQNQFADVEHDPITNGGQAPKNNSIIRNGTSAQDTESKDEFRVRRSGDNIVIDITESDELSKPSTAAEVKRQILHLVDQISKQDGRNFPRKLITEIDLNSMDRKPQADQYPKPVQHFTAELSKSASGNVQLILKDVPEVTITREKFQSNVTENGLNNQRGKPAQKISLKNIIQAFSEKVDLSDKKQPIGDSGKIRLSSEQKQPVRLSDLPEKKSPVIKELKLNTQADRKLQAAPQNLSEISGENTKTDKQLAGKSGSQTVKHSSVIQQMEKSPVQPVQTSSNPKTMEGEFKPLVQVATESSDTEMEIQARADKDTSENDEGRSFFKSNNTNVGHASKNSGRSEFSAQMVKHLQKQAEQAGAGAQKTWSHHRFVLENGEAVNLSVRQSEGVMQLQLSAGNSELNKILHQHINEIREHLQEQMSIDIDLQLQHFGDQQTDNSGNDSGNEKHGHENESEGIWHNSRAEVEVRKETMRYLGFNNNEWTA